MQVKQKRDLGFGMMLLALSGIFLFDPITNFQDVLPDVIAYLLLFFGLYFLSDLSEQLAQARHLFGVLCGVGAAQIFAQMLMQTLIKKAEQDLNPYEIPTATLLFSFLLLLAKLLLLLPAYRHLFLGLGRLADRTEGTNILRSKQDRPFFARMSRLCTAFVIVSAVASLLPELTALTSLSNAGGASLSSAMGGAQTEVPFEEWFSTNLQSDQNFFDWFPYVSLFRILTSSISLIFGVIWLVSYLRFFILAIKDQPWIERLRERYRCEILTQTDMLTVRQFRRAFLCFLFGAIFTAGLRISHYDVLPDAVFALSTVLGILCLGKFARGKGLCYSFAIPLTLVSLAHFICTCIYLRSYVPMDAQYYEKAYDLFLAVRLLGSAEAALSIALILSLMRLLYRTVCEHSGVVYEGEEALSGRATEQLHRTHRRGLLTVGILFSVASLGNAIESLLRIQLPWLWLATIAVSLIAVWKFLYFLQDTREEIEGYHHSNGMNKHRG